MCVCACVCVCVRACVRACARVCVCVNLCGPGERVLMFLNTQSTLDVELSSLGRQLRALVMQLCHAHSLLFHQLVLHTPTPTHTAPPGLLLFCSVLQPSWIRGLATQRTYFLHLSLLTFILIIIGIPSLPHSFFPGLKTSSSASPSHRSLPFLYPD